MRLDYTDQNLLSGCKEAFIFMVMEKVRQLCQSTREKLKQAVDITETFLNSVTLSALAGTGDAETEEFYRCYLSDLRHLLVFSQLNYEKLGVALRRKAFQVDFAERILHETYHTSVNSFFFPKNECYSEDGRYVYTGKDAIRFRKKPVPEVRDLTNELFKIFEEMRDELSYYDTDYITKQKMKSGQA